MSENITSDNRKKNIEAIYPLSPMQQGMLFHSLYAPESGVYFEQLTCILRGDLDVLAFRRAWQEVANRQSVLRTSFVWKRLDRTLQVVHKDIELPVNLEDWSGEIPEIQEKRLQDYLQSDRVKGFDLGKPPLLRLALCRISEATHYFVWSQHHTILDGWSVPLLLKEVFAYYEVFTRGGELRLTPARPYREYIAWLQSQTPAVAEDYWRKVLRGISTPTPLVIDRSSFRTPSKAQSFSRDGDLNPTWEQEIQFSQEFTAEINSFVRRQHLTLSTIIQAAWALLLSRYSGEQEILFGTTVSGRPANLPGSENMIGLFINTLPFRVSVKLDDSVGAWLEAIQASAAEARQFEHSSLVEVQEWSEIPRGTPLFESIIVFENYPVEQALRDQLSGAAGEKRESTAHPGRISIENIKSIEQTNYPLTIISGPGERLGIKISYDSGRFDHTAIKLILGHLQQIIRSIIANPSQRISRISILTDEERRQLLVEWNDTDASFPVHNCIHHIFEEKVELHPEALAVIYQGATKDSIQQLTYRELNQRANILSRYLIELGVGPDVLVGISVERSIDMIVAILGVLKAGGAYLPVDANYPIDRIRFMIEDSRILVLLTQRHLVDRIFPSTITSPSEDDKSNVSPLVICIDRNWSTIEGRLESPTIRTSLANYSDENPITDVKSDNLAYVIYTSGSTGQPKGTLLRHRGLCNLVIWQRDHLNVPILDTQRRILQFASFSFDSSVYETFLALCHGDILVLSDQEVITDGINLPHFLKDHSINTIITPPSFLKVLPADKMVVQELPALETIISAGEALTHEIVERLAEGRRFFNGYGPTEATICTSMGLCHVDDQPDPSIGKPICNTHVYIVDTQLDLVPVGVPGELLVGGAGVAKGYLNRPELTEEKFISNPFSSYLEQVGLIDRAEERLYRTGDLVRYRPDGNLEFLGRIDEQVKIRGFRVELGEIEKILHQNQYIQSAVVALREDTPGEKRLVAYIVLKQEFQQNFSGDPVAIDSTISGELRDFLQQRLPEFMIPTIYISLDSIPLTPNGKVDRKSLPAPDRSSMVFGTTYVEPRTPVESLIAGIWERVLNAPRVGAYDNFYSLGGHSLNATQVMSRLRNVFQVEIPLRDLFEAPTVSGLAEKIEAALRNNLGLEIPDIEPLARNQDSGLPVITPEISFAQQRLWFLDQLTPGNLFYNLPLAVFIDGQLSVHALENTLNEIIRRHAVLRTNFLAVRGKPVQVISPFEPVKLIITDLSHLPEGERIEEARRLAEAEGRKPFNLAVDRLIRMGLLRLEEENHLILLTMHHIISDGWSMGVFLREVSALYPTFLQGVPSPLPELKIQYFDFAHWQRSWLQGERLQRQLGYWQEKLANQPSVINLPTDYPRPAIQSWQGATETFEISDELSNRLHELSRQEGVTLFMTLLAAFQTLLFRYSGQPDISVGTAIANRNRSEIEPLIGFFVNTLVMRTDLSGEPSFKELLVKVREVALGAYAHQDLPFEMLVETLQPDRDLSHTPLFQVAFALQNATTGDAIVELNRSTGGGLRFRPLEVDTGSSKFDLTLNLVESQRGILGSLEYNIDLFKTETIRRMISHLTTLLEGVVADPQCSIVSLPLLTEAERKQILVDWNSTVLDAPVDRCAHQLFEAQVDIKPDAIAVIFEDQALSYQQLNQRAEQLAVYLNSLGVGQDRLVGVMVERSIDMIVAILAIMKAGGAYLPLDPGYPTERLEYMLTDSEVDILLTQSWLTMRIPSPWIDAHRGIIVYLDQVHLTTPSLPDQQKGGYFETGLSKKLSPENLAYVIYTSGSTGRPKGTMLRHRGLSNLTEFQRRAFGISEGIRVLQFSPSSFDASIWEIFMALANGGTLILARQEILGAGFDLLNLLRDKKINAVTLPPSVLRLFTGEQINIDSLPDLQTVISAGEACTPDIVNLWAPGRKFFNAYGPTETTVCASMYQCSPDMTQSPPIGWPIGNTKLYVLDPYLQPVPVGIPGELFVSGVSLAIGYINQPAMTAEKFISSPFINDLGYENPEFNFYTQLYKTGDLVRYRSDGNIEFIGRIDQQVKVRGFRIELGEIEAALNSHPDLEDAAVIARDEGAGETRLVAFIVPRVEQIEVNEIRNYLRQTLPEYMLPTAYVFMEALPVTPSGKVDRKALAVIQITDRPELKSEYIAPRNEIENQLCDICADLLHLEKVGIFDNFFELGGHSLLATQFVSHVKDAFQVELPLRKLFEAPTIAEIAEYIQQFQVSLDKDDNRTTDRIRLTEMLQRINELSDEDVKNLLVQKRTAEDKE